APKPCSIPPHPSRFTCAPQARGCLLTTTTVREPRVLTATLEDGRLAPGPPDAAEGVAHLAHRHVGPCGVDDRGHQVGVAARVGLEPLERGLDGGGVAALAHGLHALDLCPLERGVDAEKLHRGFLLERVLIDADDHALA